jgi:hypothetical protein
MSEQIKYSFDAVSLKKMAKGMLYAIAPSVITGAIMFLKEAKWESTIVSMLMPFVIMILQNVGKEFIAGIPANDQNIPEVKDERGLGTEPKTGIDKSF